MDFSDNKRQNVRYLRHDKLFVQLLADAESVNVVGKTVYCDYQDASVNGLKIESDTELTANNRVDLWVAFEGMSGKFYLRGHVRWCQPIAGDSAHFQLGIELEDAYATDYAAWTELLRSFED